MRNKGKEVGKSLTDLDLFLANFPMLFGLDDGDTHCFCHILQKVKVFSIKTGSGFRHNMNDGQNLTINKHGHGAFRSCFNNSSISPYDGLIFLDNNIFFPG